LYQLDPRANHLVGQAMHAYNMLAEGDRVLVAVSGGIDSLVLLWLLHHWRQKAPIHYNLLAVHLDMGFEPGTLQAVADRLRTQPVEYILEQTDFGRRANEGKNRQNNCYHCAKQRRNRLFDLARERGCTKIAFGHHREDLIETFFLNLLYSGNLSTMVPRQDLFNGRLALIRPLALLEKTHIKTIAEGLHIEAVPNPCPLAHDSKREEVRSLLQSLRDKDSRILPNIFAALANVKPNYLLTNLSKGANPGC
jgi:tRNA 2-thiocytidine biosynthesis protein TtcA